MAQPATPPHERGPASRSSLSWERGHLARMDNRGPSARCGQDARAPGKTTQTYTTKQLQRRRCFRPHGVTGEQGRRQRIELASCPICSLPRPHRTARRYDSHRVWKATDKYRKAPFCARRSTTWWTKQERHREAEDSRYDGAAASDCGPASRAWAVRGTTHSLAAGRPVMPCRRPTESSRSRPRSSPNRHRIAGTVRCPRA